MQSWAGNTGIAFLSRGTSSQIYIQNSTPDISGGPGLQGGFVQLSPWRNGSGALIIPAPMYVRTSQSQNHWSQSSCGSHPRPSACRGLRDRLDDSSTDAGGAWFRPARDFRTWDRSTQVGGRRRWSMMCLERGRGADIGRNAVRCQCLKCHMPSSVEDAEK
jgi:hypothetical protein